MFSYLPQQSFNPWFDSIYFSLYPNFQPQKLLAFPMTKTNRLVKLLSNAFAVFVLCGLIACNSSKNIKKDFIYFQNGEDNAEVRLREQVIQPNDMLNIQVISKSTNQQQTEIFNAPGNGSGNAGGLGYLVSMAGEIEMPVVGSVKASGLTRAQLQAVVAEKLTPYVKDPAVFIRLLPFSINILGEVKVPGQHTFAKDRVTIIDAISSAGDLTDFGKRDSILVIREEGGRRKYYNVDLKSKTLFQSPVYQLQANDIVYVEANDIKLKTLDINPASQRKLQNFLSIISLVTALISVGSLIIAISK